MNPVRGARRAARPRRVGPVQPRWAKRRDLPPELGAAIDPALRPPGRARHLADLTARWQGLLLEVDDQGGVVSRHPVEDAYELPSWSARAAAAVGDRRCWSLLRARRPAARLLAARRRRRPAAAAILVALRARRRLGRWPPPRR